MGDRRLLKRRSWRWLRARILGLLATDSRIVRKFQPTEEEVARGAQHR